ncbi:MAG: HAMP domain-containing histidine kinase [bacterium]|nr:HAMP domain-containing histidine kinase [bacterium]
MRHLIVNQRDELVALNLELNARNADLDAFARAVAHDLKNPLAAIIGLADTLGDDPHLLAIDQTRDSARSIVQAGDRAVEIIDGLLLLHGIRHESPELIPIDTEAAVDTALKALSQVIIKTEATVTRTGPFPSVQGHGAWLVQVWVNLISNAIKYGGSPPAIGLAALATSDGMVRFEVTDNGRGVAPDDRTRIFREYERIATTGTDGHGLGLAIVDRVVGRLHGTVGVDNTDNGGSVFWFTLPSA